MGKGQRSGRIERLARDADAGGAGDALAPVQAREGEAAEGEALGPEADAEAPGPGDRGIEPLAEDSDLGAGLIRAVISDLVRRNVRAIEARIDWPRGTRARIEAFGEERDATRRAVNLVAGAKGIADR